MAAVKIERREKRCFNIIGGILVGIVSLTCILPMIMIVSGSFSNEELVMKNGYALLPQGLSLDAYHALFRNTGMILLAYRNTVVIAVVGTMVGLFFTAMTAYVLQRSDFAWRNVLRNH